MGGGSNPIESAVRTYAAVVSGGLTEAGKAANDHLVENPKKKADEAAKEQIRQQEMIEAGITEQETKDEAVVERNQARNKQKALAVKAAGRRSTILTSPLGVAGDEGGSRKTLLGQ